MPTQTEIRSQITAQIIASLEKDFRPWRMPWRRSANAGRPTSVATSVPYTGINPFLLTLHAEELGFRSRWWGTFQQWRKLGLTVRKRPSHVEDGKWGAKICFYRPVTKTVVDRATGEEREDSFPILRTWSVFNADQVDGAEKYQVIDSTDEATTQPDFQPAQELIDATGAEIRHLGDQAFYARPQPDNSWPNHEHGDFVTLPPRNLFVSRGAYYETCFHELAHWSEVRLNWDYQERGYAAGELVAEIAACQLSAELGIPDGETLTNHAEYVRHWLQAMRNDSSFIFKAASQASKVTDFLLSFVRPVSQPIDAVEQVA